MHIYILCARFTDDRYLYGRHNIIKNYILCVHIVCCIALNNKKTTFESNAFNITTRQRRCGFKR